MGSGKTMLVSEMAQAVLKEDAPVCIEAFDGSTIGPEDADLQVRVTSPKAIYQLASNLNEIGLARAYILGYFDIEGLDVADPYPQLRKLVELASYIRKPSPLELARMGATVIGTDINEDGANRINAALAEAGAQGRGLVMDVRDAAQIDAVIDMIDKEYGGVYVLVNNAGITRDNLAMRMKDDEWDMVIETNLHMGDCKSIFFSYFIQYFFKIRFN